MTEIDTIGLDPRLANEARAFFNDTLSNFDQSSTEWELEVREKHIKHPWRHDYGLLACAEKAQAYNARFSILLEFARQGAPLELVDCNIEDAKSDTHVWPLAERTAIDYLHNELVEGECIGTPTLDPVHALARSIWLGEIYLPDDHYLMTSTTAGPPTRLARAWAKENGVLPDALVTSMLSSERIRDVGNTLPTARDKILMYMLMTAPEHPAKPLTPEEFHTMATHNLGNTVYIDPPKNQLPPPSRRGILRRALGPAPTPN